MRGPEEGVDEVLSLLRGGLGRRRHSARRHAENVRHSAERANRIAEQFRSLTCLVRVLRQLALHGRRASLAAPGLGDHDLGLCEPQQRVELPQQFAMLRHDDQSYPMNPPVRPHPTVAGHKRPPAAEVSTFG